MQLEQKATIGTMKIEVHYDAKKNVTKITKQVKNKGENDDENEGTKEILPGLVIINLVTDNGEMRINY